MTVLFVGVAEITAVSPINTLLFAMQKQDFQTLKAELLKVDQYIAIRCRHERLCLEPPANEMTYFQGAMLAIAHADVDNETRAVGYWALARCLKSGESATLPDRTVFTEGQLCQEALKYWPTFAYAYSGLGVSMTIYETVVVGGRSFVRSELFLEAIRLQPSNPAFYYNLSSVMMSTTAVELFDGRRLGCKGLLFEALRHCPDFSFAYLGLGRLALGTTIQMPDGRELNDQQLFIEAVRCDANLPEAYVRLAMAMIARKCPTVTLSDGRTVSPPDVMLEALRCDPDNERYMTAFTSMVPLREPWTRRSHELVYPKSNALFYVFLLALQRLEVAAVLPPTHYTMLEDMLEACWTWADERELGYI